MGAPILNTPEWKDKLRLCPSNARKIMLYFRKINNGGYKNHSKDFAFIKGIRELQKHKYKFVHIDGYIFLDNRTAREMKTKGPPQYAKPIDAYFFKTQPERKEKPKKTEDTKKKSKKNTPINISNLIHQTAMMNVNVNVESYDEIGKSIENRKKEEEARENQRKRELQKINQNKPKTIDLLALDFLSLPLKYQAAKWKRTKGIKACTPSNEMVYEHLLN